ncbi:MAG: YabP/YqfC family sporulation protein [Candidatus Ornithomonoglobus sp.]
MIKNESAVQAKHTLMLEDRSKMTLSGVKEVTAFSDTSVTLKTMLGLLLIQGKGLNISRLNTDTGDLNVNGEINIMRYSKDKSSGGFFDGLFR